MTTIIMGGGVKNMKNRAICGAIKSINHLLKSLIIL